AEMRAGDELERRCPRHRIDRNPHAAGLRARDVVVRLILVPLRPLDGARLLYEHVVVIEANARTSGELTCNRAGRRAAHELFVLRDPLPVAEVLEETARVVGPAGDQRP